MDNVQIKEELDESGGGPVPGKIDSEYSVRHL